MVSIKGTPILDSIRAVKERDGESKYQQILQLLDEDGRRLFENKIMATSWYPLDAFVRFLAADLSVTAGGDERMLRRRSALVVEKQLRGIYRAFVRLSSTEFVLQRLSAVHKTYFSGVTIDVRSTGACRAAVRYVGFEPQHRLMERVVEGFFGKALEISGAKDVTLSFSAAAADHKGYWELDLAWSERR